MSGVLQRAITDLRPRNSHGQVVGTLGREIVAGVYPPGSILPGEGELGGRFGVSRTVLREAMKTLAAKSLIEARTRVGTRVLERHRWNLLDHDVLSWRVEAGLDDAFVAHLATMRLAFEPAAAALAAEQATDEDIARLHEIVDRMGDAGHDRASIARTDLEFHLAIAEMSRNPFMLAIGSLIEAALTISLKHSSPASDRALIAEVAGNHRAIVDAIAQRDEAATRAAMARVIELGSERTLRSLGKTAGAATERSGGPR
ncbi:FadR/GntR family transcriptional regulator [Amorphus orientalis]|uniref:DNA-binding FadR family transcriptional regulator n=1 Tax=Amorphus orientalis TaxID=649198 RepID=A0AAE4ARE0_9HYPH|nr:FadR/GntR family transcriptional regulator [Amorphus orientalis]MDQ0313755.1 DNA-binding FadR family transcriptional regulator [Amorphus orientalis]